MKTNIFSDNAAEITKKFTDLQFKNKNDTELHCQFFSTKSGLSWPYSRQYINFSFCRSETPDHVLQAWYPARPFWCMQGHSKSREILLLCAVHKHPEDALLSTSLMSLQKHLDFIISKDEFLWIISYSAHTCFPILLHSAWMK